MNEDVTILIIDDDEVDVMDVQRRLKRRGIENPLITAGNGEEALEKLRSNDKNSDVQGPYLILLDIRMPKMDGFEFLQELRADERLMHATVFVLTTSDCETDRERAYKKHVAGYLLKYQSEGELLDRLQVVEDYLRLNRFPPR